MRSSTGGLALLLTAAWILAEAAGAPPATDTDIRVEAVVIRPLAQQAAKLKVVFDGFDGKLGLKWLAHNPDPSHVSLTKKKGALTITTQEGGFQGENTNYKNLYLLKNPIAEGKNFQLTTCLLGFSHSAGFQQAGLVCFDDEDNYIKWVYEAGSEPGIRRLALLRETQGNSVHAYAGGAAPPKRLWLRLTKRGRYYIYSSSIDGKRFQVYGERLWGDGAPKFVGLVAKNAANCHVPEIDASFDFFEIREKRVVERPVDRYAVPAGGVPELLAFVEKMRGFRPQNEWVAAEHQRRAPAATKFAATRILTLENDEWSKAFQTALLVLLEDRVRAMQGASPEEQQQTLAHVKTFLTAKGEKGLQPEEVDLAIAAAAAVELGGQFDLAAQAYADFAKLVAQNKKEGLAPKQEVLTGAVRRFDLPGKEIKLEGTKADGSKFDWSAYRGKVVLVYFWASDSEPCRAELPGIRLNYRLYHDRGFEVVGISTDGDRQALEEFLAKEPLPWVILHEREPGATHPMVTHYGVTGVPTALLVDKEGKVVSLRARGSELDKLLAQLIGLPYDVKGKLVHIDLQPKANQKLTEKLHNVPDNDLKELPQGEQTFAGIKFRVGENLIQLAGSSLEGRPQAVNGIQVNKRLTALFFFHGTGWKAKDGTVIAQYKVHYEDQTAEAVPIVYGEDVRNWLTRSDQKRVTRGRVAWVGNNASERRAGGTIRVYLGVWKNPHPEKKVVSIDCISANTIAAPFCVAITAAVAPEGDQSTSEEAELP